MHRTALHHEIFADKYLLLFLSYAINELQLLDNSKPSGTLKRQFRIFPLLPLWHSVRQFITVAQ